MLVGYTAKEYAEQKNVSLSTARRFLHTNSVKATKKKLFYKTPFNDSGRKRVEAVVYYVEEIK
jgi:response regulator of citrate/malate metabolism